MNPRQTQRLLPGLLMGLRKPGVNFPSKDWKRIMHGLSKSKLSTWIMLSSWPGYFLLGTPCLSSFVGLSVGTFLCSAGANTMNQIIERSLDSQMERTKNRPLPRNIISIEDATKLSVLMGCCGVSVLLSTTNPLAAFLGGTNYLAYSFLYTPMKTQSPYNTHIGSLIGSIPIIMGGTAVMGFQALYNPTLWLLFTLQTLWQFPHFYALAWLCRKDYKTAKYQMFPCYDETGLATAKMMKPYLTGITLLPIVFVWLDLMSPMYGLTTLIVNYGIHLQFKKFKENPCQKTIRGFFMHSLWHILALLGLTVIHSPHFSDTTNTFKKSLLEDHCFHNQLSGLGDFCFGKSTR